MQTVGRPPMQYLALWRMQLASRLLAEGGPLAAVAGAVGYGSEAAFSRAFKKLVGQPPATWRKGTAPRTDSERMFHSGGEAHAPPEDGGVVHPSVGDDESDRPDVGDTREGIRA